MSGIVEVCAVVSDSLEVPCPSLIGVSETCVSIALGEVVTVEKSCDADVVLVNCDRIQPGDVDSIRPDSVEDRVFIMLEGSQQFFVFFHKSFQDVSSLVVGVCSCPSLVLRSQLFVLSSSFLNLALPWLYNLLPC